ncbi:transmembrane prediction [Roseiconus lacunae]|uniref:Transmembrane prediction n=1 Tax=Roseiconus lacunae TaxID=2605694 RepID=A0ABT7PP83_9BACT|nr:transmembrane prediction [Roseiconus lacunae]MDM4018276.1 transmembrane prediction [Roseiconus lacunae]
MTTPTESSKTYERRSIPISSRLWWLTIAPTVWAIHFLACYLAAAIYCAKASSPEESMPMLRIAVAILTGLAIVMITFVAFISFRQHRMGDAPLPHDFDSQDDQQRFLGFAAFLLSLLSIIATLFTASVFVFLGACH